MAPLPRQAAEPLAAHVERFPPREVTLPWLTPDGKLRTLALVFTGGEERSVQPARIQQEGLGARPPRRRDTRRRR